jgi:hypothetical protein
MHRRRTLPCATSGAAVLVLAVTGQVGSSAAGAAADPAAGPAQKVVVVTQDRLPATPVTKKDMRARVARATASQSAVLERLCGPKPTAVHHFAVGNAFSATVTSGVIHVTITPHGRKGEVLTGRLNVVIPPALPTGFNAQPYYSTGSVIQALSYTYRIG